MVNVGIHPIAVAAITCALAMIAEHYFPWEMALGGKKLPRPAAYILGTVSILLPLTWLYAYYAAHPPANPWEWLIALWVVAAAGGFAVLLAYFADWVMHQASLARELAEIIRFKDETDHASSDCYPREEA